MEGFMLTTANQVSTDNQEAENTNPRIQLEQVASKPDKLDKVLDIVCADCPLYTEWPDKQPFCQWALCHCG